MQTEKRPGLYVATHYSEETAAVEKCRKDVETVTCKPQVNVTRTAETTQIRSDALSLCLLEGLSLRLTYFWFPVVRSFILFLCLLT